MWSNLMILEGDGGLLSSMPDPMRPYLPQVIAVILLVSLLVVVLKKGFFAPLGDVLAERARSLSAGSDTKAQAMALLDSRQKDYDAQLRDLRQQAAQRRKALADAAAAEKTRLVDAARAKANASRTEAFAALDGQREAAKKDLVAQVDQLADAMAQQLVKA
jgi:F0F1-type ATP synthase membrane subunit b/b'